MRFHFCLTMRHVINSGISVINDEGYDEFREEVFSKANITSTESKLKLEELVISKYYANL